MLRHLTRSHDLHRYVVGLKQQIGKSWLSVEIPHCCPVAIREMMADVVQPRRWVIPDPESKAAYDDSMAQAFASNVNVFPDGIRMLSGHFKARHILECRPPRTALRMTMLRDPVQRLLEAFAVEIAEDATPGKRDVVLARLREFALRPANRNVIAQYLSTGDKTDSAEIIQEIESEFDFIGLYEDMTLTVKMFYAIHNIRCRYVPVSEDSSSKLLVADLPKSLLTELSALNSLDYAIFQYFHSNILMIKDYFFQQCVDDKIFLWAAPTASSLNAMA